MTDPEYDEDSDPRDELRQELTSKCSRKWTLNYEIKWHARSRTLFAILTWSVDNSWLAVSYFYFKYNTSHWFKCLRLEYASICGATNTPHKSSVITLTSLPHQSDPKTYFFLQFPATLKLVIMILSLLYFPSSEFHLFLRCHWNNSFSAFKTRSLKNQVKLNPTAFVMSFETQDTELFPFLF